MIFTVQNKMQLLVPYILCVHLIVSYSCNSDQVVIDYNDEMEQVFKFQYGIIGGSRITIEKAPYLAAILRKNGKYRRLGTVIGKRFILTSAYVCEDTDIDTIDTVRVGTSDFTKGGQLIDIEKVIKHEDFDDIYSHDIALVKLVSDIQYSETVKPIKLTNISGEVGTTATLTGFAPSLANNSFYMVEGIQTIIDRKDCEEQYEDDIVPVDESNMCAFNISVCACKKDDAAPFVQSNNLIAMFVGGSFCCRDKKPQVYVDVPIFNNWIMKHLIEQGYDERDNYGHYFGE